MSEPRLLELCGGPLDGDEVEFDEAMLEMPTWAVPTPWNAEELERWHETASRWIPQKEGDELALKLEAQLELTPPFIPLTHTARPLGTMGRPAPGYYAPGTLFVQRGKNGKGKGYRVLLYRSIDE